MQTRIPLTCALVALSTLTAGCPSTTNGPGAAEKSDDATQAMAYFGDKAYFVCDLGSHNSHASLGRGNHLKIDDEVRLLHSGSGLTLTLGNKQIGVAASGGGKQLKGESTFHHEAIDPGGTSEELKHEVNVTRNTGYEPPEPPAPGCNPGLPNPIIAIEFCPEKAGGGWDCKPPGTHQGDVHAQTK